MVLGIEVSVALAHERVAIANLMQLYTHDFSEHWAGSSRGELGDDGRFEAYPLDPYWTDTTRVPLLVRVDGRLAGFALVDRGSHTGRAVDHNMAEFFIARKHRRGGVGTAAAQAILTRYPGVWETAVARSNVDALSFWRRVVDTHPAVEGVEEHDVTSAEWNGPVLRFRIASPG